MRVTASRVAGLGLLAGLWAGPLPGLAGASMTAHMAMHLGAVAVAPALLAPRWPGRAGAGAVVAAAAVEMAAVWGWHAPAAQFWARTSGVGLAVEQASFLAAGLLLWAAAEGAGRIGGAAAMLATMMHMTLLGALIALSARVLCTVPGGTAFGLDPLADQQLAGGLMAAGGGAIYLAAALARLAPALAERPA